MRPVVFCALALALACSPIAAGSKPGVKWVPLNQVERGPPKQLPTSAPASAPAAVQATSPATTSEAAPTVPTPVPPPPIAAPPSAQARLDLTCFGGGTANKIKVTTVNSYASASGTVMGPGSAGMTTWNGSGSGTATAYGTRQQQFGDQVDVRLFGGDDRIRMPRTMLPPIHGGNGGWFKLKNVVADARSIRAKAAINFMNNPNVFVDRVTGTISISGRAGDYSGQCQAVTADAPAKF